MGRIIPPLRTVPSLRGQGEIYLLQQARKLEVPHKEQILIDKNVQHVHLMFVVDTESSAGTKLFD
jgi:hypothetical protein